MEDDELWSKISISLMAIFCFGWSIYYLMTDCSHFNNILEQLGKLQRTGCEECGRAKSVTCLFTITLQIQANVFLILLPSYLLSNPFLSVLLPFSFSSLFPFLPSCPLLYLLFSSFVVSFFLCHSVCFHFMHLLFNPVLLFLFAKIEQEWEIYIAERWWCSEKAVGPPEALVCWHPSATLCCICRTGLEISVHLHFSAEYTWWFLPCLFPFFSFICSFSGYLLGALCVSGTGLDLRKGTEHIWSLTSGHVNLRSKRNNKQCV